MPGWPRVSRLGEETWLVEYEPRLDVAVNARIHQLARALATVSVPGIREVVPAMASVAVHVDGDRVDDRQIEAALERLIAEPPAAIPDGELHELPVCYDAAFAMDLEEVARRCGCDPSEVVERHSAVEYRVFMIGFLPGFPYLGVLDSRLTLPRREVPRQFVPRGSVGIAGVQTGVYPSDSPGGWHIIGRTPTPLFDPDATPPSRLSPGDRVRFVPTTTARFEALMTARGAEASL
jgi:KipI family sensor histidine kinase inhibitor